MRILFFYFLLAAIGCADYVTGNQVRLGSLYLLAIAFAGWGFRPRQAIVYAAACALVWISIQPILTVHFPSMWLVGWDALNKAGSVAITITMVLKAKSTLDRQRELICELRKATLSMSHYRELVPFCRMCHKLHFDQTSEKKLQEIARDDEILSSMGDICPACLQARSEHLQNIPVHLMANDALAIAPQT